MAAIGVVYGVVWLGATATVVIDPYGAGGVSRGINVGPGVVIWLSGVTLCGVVALLLTTCSWLAYLRSGNRRWKRRGLIAAPFALVLVALWVVTGAAVDGS